MEKPSCKPLKMLPLNQVVQGDCLTVMGDTREHSSSFYGKPYDDASVDRFEELYQKIRRLKEVSLPINQVVQGDCLKTMNTFPADSIDFVMFSPPI